MDLWYGVHVLCLAISNSIVAYFSPLTQRCLECWDHLHCYMLFSPLWHWKVLSWTNETLVRKIQIRNSKSQECDSDVRYVCMHDWSLMCFLYVGKKWTEALSINCMNKFQCTFYAYIWIDLVVFNFYASICFKSCVTIINFSFTHTILNTVFTEL